MLSNHNKTLKNLEQKFEQYRKEIERNKFSNYCDFINIIVTYSEYLIAEDLMNEKKSRSPYYVKNIGQIDSTNLYEDFASILNKFEIKKVFKQLFSLYRENLLHADLIKMVRDTVMKKYKETNTSDIKYIEYKDYKDFFDLVSCSKKIIDFCNERIQLQKKLYDCILTDFMIDEVSKSDVIEFFQLDMKLRESIKGLLELNKRYLIEDERYLVDSNYNCYVISIIKKIVTLHGISLDSALLNMFKGNFIVNIKVDFYESPAFYNFVKILNKYIQLRDKVRTLNNLSSSNVNNNTKEQWLRDFINTDSTIGFKWFFKNNLQSITIHFDKNNINVKIKNNVSLIKNNSNNVVNNITEYDEFIIKNYPAFFDSELEVIDGIKRNFVFKPLI